MLTDCNSMNMLEGYETPIRLSGSSDRQVEESLLSCLKECIKRRTIDYNKETSEASEPQQKETKKGNKRKKRKQRAETIVESKTDD